MKEYLWTLNGARLQYQSHHENNGVNWLFLPGGPGLGSEALIGLTQLLKNKIPGVIWHLDLPNDGSNLLKDNPISNWRTSIIQAVQSFDNVILVAHSTPAMYIQTMPELEKILYGCVFIGTAPNASWQTSFHQYSSNNIDENILAAEKSYKEKPDNESLRKLLISSAKFCFVREKSLKAGKELFSRIPVNHLAAEQSANYFDSQNYKATWIPKMTTLIIAGDEDCITPLHLYREDVKYKQKNFLIREISGAGHYPWYENPAALIKAFQEYFETLSGN